MPCITLPQSNGLIHFISEKLARLGRGCSVFSSRSKSPAAPIPPPTHTVTVLVPHLPPPYLAQERRSQLGSRATERMRPRRAADDEVARDPREYWCWMKP